MSERKIIFQWGVSSLFGWGVIGLNLALYARGKDLIVATACPFAPEELGIDAARLWVLRDFIAASRRLIADLTRCEGRVPAPDCLVLHALGNRFQLAALGANQTVVMGGRTIGVAVFEDTAFDMAALDCGRGYEKLIAGSRWNAELLKAKGLDRVELLLQGVDPSLFHPAPRAGLFDGRFALFSGGKLELRKGQDIVLKAFRIFRQRHPEALLLTAWHSPWSKILADNMAAALGGSAVPVGPDGNIDSRAWAQANGVPAEAVIDLGAVPNALMPALLREADAALFPNRCEGATNLVAMEAMACGVPAVLSANTGHLDLIEPGNCYPLRRQVPIGAATGWTGTEGWGESDPEEIVAALEAIYTDRQAARARGEAGAATLAKRSWRNQIGELLKMLE